MSFEGESASKSIKMPIEVLNKTIMVMVMARVVVVMIVIVVVMIVVVMIVVVVMVMVSSSSFCRATHISRGRAQSRRKNFARIEDGIEIEGTMSHCRSSSRSGGHILAAPVFVAFRSAVLDTCASIDEVGRAFGHHREFGGVGLTNVSRVVLRLDGTRMDTITMEDLANRIADTIKVGGIVNCNVDRRNGHTVHKAPNMKVMNALNVINLMELITQL